MFVLVGVSGRFILIEYIKIPNFEIITALSLISGIYLGGVYSVLTPLLIMFLSDLAIGNNYVFVFTWTAFVFISLFGTFYKRQSAKQAKPSMHITIFKSFKNKLLTDSILLAITSSIFFFLYTNFGWWLVSGMYEYSLSGLLKCYFMAIPFFRNNLLGNLLFVPLGFYVASKVCSAKYENHTVKKHTAINK